MECTVSWTGAVGTRSAMGFLAETGSGHVLAMDGAPDVGKPENGGQNLAARPMELLLAGMGGCTAYDVVLILKRGRHAVSGCEVRLTAERAEADPKVFTRIHLQFTVTGKGLPPAAVLCELMLPDGTMARRDDAVRFADQHNLPVLTIEDIVQYREQMERAVSFV